ncbi:MAG: hypothetical protein AB1467_04455 [Candidatus Diapherotrites archaeon]
MAKKDEGLGRSKGRGFWSVQKIFMLFLLIFGFIVGVYVAHQFIEPSFNKQVTSGLAVCEAKKAVQDNEINSLFSCLESNNIDPQKCE